MHHPECIVGTMSTMRLECGTKKQKRPTPGPGQYTNILRRSGKQHIAGSTFGRTQEKRLFTANNDVIIRDGYLVSNTDPIAQVEANQAAPSVRRNSSQLGDHLCSSMTATLKQSESEAQQYVRSVEDNLLRQTPTFSSSRYPFLAIAPPAPHHVQIILFAGVWQL